MVPPTACRLSESTMQGAGLRIRFVVCLSVVLLGIKAPSTASGDEPLVDFNRDILPLFSENCFQCHGPDGANREAGLRLDNAAGAFAELDSGDRAIVPHDLENSVLVARILSDDPAEKMPPAESGKSLTAEQIDTIQRWISAGANWQGHWAFQTPRRPSLPPAHCDAGRNEIDRFVHARLVQAGLEFSAEADKATLIRRATFDLTGLPPTIAEIDAFLADASADAYEKVVDRLLSSSQYGEHMARHWLDAARYADTHGLHLDNERSLWPFRNWVIDAFNQNMPFDQFTLEQLAGDLLPNPTLAQRVATGFNRCNVTTGEGGSIDAEYYVRYAVERVETTSTVWLGLTAGCAACHDHKFDPLTQKEFYQLFSYFYSLTEKAMDRNVLLPPPSIKVPSPRQLTGKAKLHEQLATTEQAIQATLASVRYSDPLTTGELPPIDVAETIWIDDALPIGAVPEGNGETPWQFVSAPDHPVHSGEKSTFRTGNGLTQHFFTKADPPLRIGAKDRLFAHVYLDGENPPKTIQLQFNDGDWNHRAYWGADKGHAAGQKGPANHHMGDLPEKGQWVRLEVAAKDVGLKPDSAINGWAFTQFGGTVHWDQAGIVTVAPLSEENKRSLRVWENYHSKASKAGLPKPIQEILALDAESRDADQRKQLEQYYVQHVNPDTREQFQQPLQQIADIKKQIADLENSIPGTMVMEERPQPRQAYVLERGEYTLQRDKVSSRVPRWLPNQVLDAPANRLGLAQWIVDPANPLTARVTVNRFWQQYFGVGLVKTAEDFGVQGERPSHPALLDWLATDFIDNGWNVKRLQRQIVTSQTYRQSSNVTPEHLQKDPDNRLLARGPRFRLDAEIIRDNALMLAGLLVDTIGGRSVKPYQPAGLWKPVGFGGSNTSEFKQDHGAALFRRSMYTFWKRTSPPPSMDTFDAPNRETCQVRRARTNTPLQALVLMNDVQFVEAARRFAERVIESSADQGERVTFALRSATARHPNDRERQRLIRLYQEFRKHFDADPQAAEQLLQVGESTLNETMNASELAAWTMVTHLILNLDEVITKS